ncbi:hypothetical protein SAMN05192583_2951 [Sphingomonas gellani]|uniref:Uncharacterized protein n=1 Tax=Sphingomonas gellani TaxID=1166340 RepID=A0A1H8H6M8_9SPHN|nr:hypothetical protein SAMN05192583_2951 [Sphingomonas gellani]
MFASLSAVQRATVSGIAALMFAVVAISAAVPVLPVA